jgi:hypothetical protein
MRDEIIKLLAPLFPESGAAGEYISDKGTMLVAGNEITLIFKK